MQHLQNSVIGKAKSAIDIKQIPESERAPSIMIMEESIVMRMERALGVDTSSASWSLCSPFPSFSRRCGRNFCLLRLTSSTAPAPLYILIKIFLEYLSRFVVVKERISLIGGAIERLQSACFPLVKT